MRLAEICAATIALWTATGVLARAPEAPVVFKTATADADVTLKIPASLRAYPELYADLLKTDVANLKRFLIQAKSMRAAVARSGPPDRRYWRVIEYEPAAATARLVSLAKRQAEDTGGAHLNDALVAVIWDRTVKRRIRFLSLFRPDVDWGRLDRALCDAVKATKTRAEATPIDGHFWTCPKWRKSAAVLAPSTVQGKAGGLVFLFSPYEVGPYVEGEWRVPVPLEAFRSALAPAYAGEFAGQRR